MFYEIFRNDPDPNPDNTETDRSGFTTPWTQQNVRKYTKSCPTNIFSRISGSGQLCSPASPGSRHSPHSGTGFRFYTTVQYFLESLVKVSLKKSDTFLSSFIYYKKCVHTL